LLAPAEAVNMIVQLVKSPTQV